MQLVENDTDPLQDETVDKAPPGALVCQLPVELDSLIDVQDSTPGDVDNPNSLSAVVDDRHIGRS